MRKLLPAIMITFALSASSQDFRKTEVVFGSLDTVSMPSREAAAKVFTANPALRAFQYDFSITDVRVDYLHEGGSEATRLPWEGTSNHHVAGGVDAYLKVNPKLTAWGDASYTAARRFDVRWCSVEDYMKVAPYVLADSVGGNVSSQRYKFSGGVAYQTGNWSFGAEAAYRAEIAYRRRDPRIKNVVSDLSVKAGASYSLGNWAIGAGLGLSVYNQESDVDFYSPVNNIRTHLLTGLGTVYPRFSGGGTSTSAYEGLGGSFSLQVVQKGKSGLKFNIGGSLEDMKQRIRDYNNLDLALTRNWTLSSQILYTFPCPVSLSAEGFWLRRIGTENLFGSAIGSSYPKIAERQNYIGDFVTGRLAVPVELSLSSTLSLDIIPAFSGRYIRSFLRTPNRLLEFSHLTPELSGKVVWRSSSHIRWSLGAKVARTFANEIADRLTGLDLESELGQNELQKAALLGSCVTSYGGELRCDFKIERCPLFYISGNGSSASLPAGTRRFLAVAAGMTF